MTKTIETMLLEWSFYLFSAFVCGFAQGTISFTASPVIVPLLLGLLNFDIMSSLFISVMIDLTGSIVLSFIYGYHKKVIIFSGICFGMLQIPMEILLPILTRNLILKYSNFLKGNIPFLPLFLGVFFFIRGIIKFIRAKILKKKNSENENEEDDIIESYLKESIDEDVNEESNEPNICVEKIRKIKNFVKEEFKENREYPSIDKPETNGFIENSIYRIRGNSGEDIIFLENLPFKLLRILFLCIAVFISSCSNGLLYKGGGFAINIIIHFFFRQKHSVSTGTACFISSFGLIGLALSFIGRNELLNYRLFSHLITGLIASSFGAICGANWVIYFSDIFVFLMIGVTMLLIGGISMLQAYI